MLKIKEMKNKILKRIKINLESKLWISTLIFGSVAVIISYAIFSLANYISSDELGFDYAVELGLQTFAVAAIAVIVMRLFRLVGASLITERIGKPMPRLLTSLFNWFVIIFAALVITTSVFNKDAGTLLAAGGIVGAGLAFALQRIIMDAFSGLVLDFEYNFKEGDWVKLANGKPGRIVGTTWRHVKVVTIDRNLLVIPNSMFATEVYENYSSPSNVYLDIVNVTMDHQVPVKHAERIMRGAIMSIDEIEDKLSCFAYAEKVTEGGVVYALCYPVGDMSGWRRRRHLVIEAVSEKLHQSGLKFSETLGEYAISKAVKKFESLKFNVCIEILKTVEIFSILTEKEIKKLAKNIEQHEIEEGEVIINEGDQSNSLFVVGEGVIEVYTTTSSKDGEIENILGTLGPGAYVGDRALLLGEKRSASVRAKSNVLVYEITKDDFMPICKSRPMLMEKLSEVMAIREQQNMLTLKSAKERNRVTKKLKDDLLKGMINFFGMN